jgi:RNA polymerase sigma-70 factor, ECF subfamily
MSERFEATYRRHVEAVFRFALSCVRRRDIAEELTSEAFLALYRNFDDIDDSRLPGWLIAVVRNRSRDYWRRQVTEQSYLRTLADEPRAAEAVADSGLLGSCELKPVHRVCLRLRYVDGLSRAEIASATGLSENQVKGHLQYSLRLLRAALAGPGR